MTLIRRFLLTLPMLATAALAQNAPLTIDSRYDFAATVTALETAIQEKGMTLFARIDHQAAAKEAGLDTRPATAAESAYYRERRQSAGAAEQCRTSGSAQQHPVQRRGKHPR